MFAAAADTSNSTLWYIGLALFVVVIAIGAPWAHGVFRAVRGEDEECPETPEGLLGPLVEAYQAGLMSEQEYLKIRESIQKAGSSDPSLWLQTRLADKKAEAATAGNPTATDPAPSSDAPSPSAEDAEAP